MLCFFNNGEKRLFDLEKALDISNRYVKKILRPDVFNKVSIGEFGEIKWDGQGEIQDDTGHLIPCDYDISPEFVYRHSISQPGL